MKITTYKIEAGKQIGNGFPFSETRYFNSFLKTSKYCVKQLLSKNCFALRVSKYNSNTMDFKRVWGYSNYKGN